MSKVEKKYLSIIFFKLNFVKKLYVTKITRLIFMKRLLLAIIINAVILLCQFFLPIGLLSTFSHSHQANGGHNVIMNIICNIIFKEISSNIIHKTNG